MLRHVGKRCRQATPSSQSEDQSDTTSSDLSSQRHIRDFIVSDSSEDANSIADHEEQPAGEGHGGE